MEAPNTPDLDAAMAAVHVLLRFEDQLTPLLAEGGTHTLRDVLDGFLSGQFTFFDNPGGVIIAQVCEYPQLTDCFLFAMAGNLKALAALVPDLTEWARAKGCTRFSAHGRKGWLRAFPGKLGATAKWIVMEAQIGRQ